jgi:hypothetical protein
MIVEVKEEELEGFEFEQITWMPPEERPKKWYEPITQAMMKPVAERLSPIAEKVLREKSPDITYALAKGLAPQMPKIVFYAMLPIGLSILALGLIYFALRKAERR